MKPINMKNTIRFARTVTALLAPPSQKMITGGPCDLHRAAAETREQADTDRDRQRRLAVIAPARREDGEQPQHQHGDEPAQHDRIDMDERHRAERHRERRRRW